MSKQDKLPGYSQEISGRQGGREGKHKLNALRRSFPCFELPDSLEAQNILRIAYEFTLMYGMRASSGFALLMKGWHRSSFVSALFSGFTTRHLSMKLMNSEES